MSTATNFNTRNDTFRRLMGNGLTYHIPRFQRDYSWGEEEWDDLWADIVGTITPGGEPAHYMGYLVLQTSDERTFAVIDGQQRLTTLSLIVLAVLKNLQRLIDAGYEEHNNRLRYEQIRQAYIGYLNSVTLVTQTKLTLNRNNNDYYQTYLVPLVDPLPQRGFRASENSLRQAFEWFDRRLRSLIRTAPNPGVTLARFVEDMSDRLFFTVITVTDELNAYKVFETLNARGVRLSATDLLKNYLFSVLDQRDTHERELLLLENRWEAIVNRLRSERFPDFLRAHWNSREAPVRQTELFKAIRREVREPRRVFTLLAELEEDLETYLGLTDPAAAGWPAAMRDAVAALRLFGIRQPFPLLLAARKRLDDEGFTQVLRATVVISFRYNIIGGLSTGDQQSTYNHVIRRMLDGKLTAANEIIQAQAGLYPPDDLFVEAFTERVFRPGQPRSSRIVRYILTKLEHQLGGHAPDIDDATMSVEHVFPQHAAAGWPEFPERNTEDHVFRLGNMTLLEAGLNRDLGNADYATKRATFAQSRYAMTRELAARNDDWTPERIASRQRWMATRAKAIWMISQITAGDA